MAPTGEDNTPPQADSAASSSINASNPASTMLVHVLSPSTEIPNQLSFPSLLPSTTVGQLKELIQNAVPTRPAPDRQRLIHRGRMLAKDTDTMADIFGPTAVGSMGSGSL